MKAKIARHIGKAPRTYRRKQPSTTAAIEQQKANRAYQRDRRLVASIRGIHPAVSTASCDELLAAGWGAYDRTRIPADWRTRRPGA